MATAAVFACTGCGGSNTVHGGGPQPGGTKDLAFAFSDDGGPMATDDAGGGMMGDPNLCGDWDPQCMEWNIGPDNGKPFSLPSDPMPDPMAGGSGVGRNPQGYLTLDQTQASFHFIWLAQDSDGSVSKVDSKTMKEVARYKTYTCFSLPKGSTQACDGQGNGCCALDSEPQYQARKNKQADPGPQNVQKSSNSPSRTAVDFNGDLFVHNRAFGGQASLTKIANDVTGCRDRNKDGKITTSYDANKNGRIDINDPTEFPGENDECIIWTTNHGSNNAVGRPLGLGAGAIDAGPSDAWAGEYTTGRFLRIDGVQGKIKADVQLLGGCNPYGLAVDA